LYEPGVKTVVGGSATYAVGPPIFYFSNMFSMWRGSVNVTIKIPKTDFHSGRLQVTWTPTRLGTTVPTLVTGQYALREIIDIKAGNEFTFNLPWMLEQNYISTSEKSGILDIKVLNELRAPETASQTVELLVYYSGGNDFELQLPGYSGGTSGYNSLPFSPQMETGDDLIVRSGIAGEKVFQHDTKHSQESTGELALSIKQFLNRNSQLNFRSFVDYGSSVLISPWFNTIPYIVTVAGLTSQNIGGDISMYMAPLYAFYRGSVRLTLSPKCETTSGYQIPRNVFYALVPDNGAASVPFTSGLTGLGSPAAVNWTAASTPIGLQGIAIHQGDIPISTVHVPYIAKNKCSLNTFLTTNANVVDDKSNPRVRVNVYSNNNFTNTSWFRSYGEDFQYTYFIGCPPILISVA